MAEKQFHCLARSRAIESVPLWFYGIVYLLEIQGWLGSICRQKLRNTQEAPPTNCPQSNRIDGLSWMQSSLALCRSFQGNSMSRLLEEAVAEARKLPDAEQEVIAALILEEIEEERRWEESFARSPEKLARLAARATEQVRAGQCRQAGFDEL